MSARRTLRIFISSSSDVRPERRVAERVINRLDREFSYHLRLEPVLWERDPLVATEHFQANITPPHQTDIVVMILWSRLGRELPADQYTGVLSGEPVTGTEWEFEDALSAWRDGGRPELLVYFKTSDPVVSLRDENEVQGHVAQKQRVDEFMARWFERDDGTASAATHPFADAANFEEQLYTHLRRLVRQYLDPNAATGHPPTMNWDKGSPFRGLESYELEHAPIFFGRDRARNELRETLATRAASGTAFVTVMGASGSGKSSLVKAGLLPDLKTPGMVGRVGLTRHAIVRPGAHADDPVKGLAEALLRHEALPELSQQKYDADRLADLLREAPTQVTPPLETALERAGAAAELAAHAETRVCIIVDQLEELFTRYDAGHGVRTAFVAALEALATSGHAYVVATMRSDFFARLDELPRLAALSQGDGRYLLPTPDTSEIAQVIRGPAWEAGVTFAVDPQRHDSLDDRILAEAGDNPDALPLLAFLLDRLWHDRTIRGELTFEAYHRLGGLSGAIGNQAEAILQAQPKAVQDALPDLVRQLVTIGADGTDAGDTAATGRTVPLATFAEATPARQLVEALLAPDARLLVTDRDPEGQDPTAHVRLAHEALLSHWARMTGIIEANREFLVQRQRIGQLARQWASEDRPRDRLLQGKRALAEGEALLARRDELPTETAAYIDQSLAAAQAAERRRTIRRRSVTAVLAVFAVVAGGFAYYAETQRRDAVEAREQARAAKESAEAARQDAEQRRKAAQEARLQAERALRVFEKSYGKLPDVHLAAAFGETPKLRQYVQQGASVDKKGLNNLTPLHVAADFGNFETVKLLVRKGANVNVLSGNSLSPLHFAAIEGELEIVEYLVKNGADTFITRSDEQPIHLAVKNGNSKVVNFLIRNSKRDLSGQIHTGRAGVGSRTNDFQRPLHYAASHGNLGLVKMLVGRGAEIDDKTKLGITPLQKAAANGHSKILSYFLDEKDASLSKRDKLGRRALHRAAAGGHEKVVEKILKSGASINAEDNIGRMPIHYATRIDDLDTVQTLLDNGARVGVLDDEEKSEFGKAAPIHYASWFAGVEVVNALLKAGADPGKVNHKGASALHASTGNQKSGITELLLDAGGSATVVTESGWTPLHSAARYGHGEIAKALLEQGAKVEAADDDGWRPLHLAARYGTSAILKVLFQNAAALHAKTDSGLTAVELAAVNGNEKIIDFLISKNPDKAKEGLVASVSHQRLNNTRLLLEHVQDADVRTNTEERWSLLHISARKGYPGITRVLLAKGKIDPGIKSTSNIKPLHFAARQGHAEIAKTLLEQGAKVEAENDDGWRPIHLAARHGHGEIAKVLVNHSAKIEVEYNDGVRALHLAAGKGHAEVAEVLLDRGAKVEAENDDGWRPLHFAARYGHGEIAKVLLEQGAKIEAETEGGWRPLHFAARHGHGEIAKVLVNHSAKIEVQYNDGVRALHLAAGKGHAEVAEVLLDRGAKVEAENDNGWRPLHFATWKGRAEVTEVLLDRGAKVEAQDNDGVRALHLASYHRHKAVAQILLQSGARVSAKNDDGDTPLDIAKEENNEHIINILNENSSERGN